MLYYILPIGIPATLVAYLDAKIIKVKAVAPTGVAKVCHFDSFLINNFRF